MSLRSALGSLSVILLLAIAAPPAEANDASFYGDGATVFAVKDERIVMEREKIRLHYDESAEDGRHWRAECEFVFRNRTDETARVQIGFPDGESMDEVDPGEGRGAIRDFQVWVDGKRVTPTYKKVDDEGRPDLPNRVELGYPAAYTWVVTFPPKGKILVKNTYRIGGLSTNGPFGSCAWGMPEELHANAWWRGAGGAEGGWDFEDSLCRAVTYVVTSGKTWAGPIGVADIAIELPERTWPQLAVPMPAATSIRDGWVRWRFKNFRPRHELRVILPLPPAREDGEARLPIFDTPRQARAFSRFARRNGLSSAYLELLIRAYERPEELDAAWVRALPPIVPRDYRPEPLTGKRDRAIVKILKRTARRLKRREVKAARRR